MPEQVFRAIDRGEPEWPFLERLVATDSPAAVVTAIALALTDYQLGDGGAARYWEVAGRCLESIGRLNSASDVQKLVGRMVQDPVASRLRDQKLFRVNRFLRSKLVDSLNGRRATELGLDSESLWNGLAEAMHQDRDAKTIVFSMKIFDLLHLISTGAYVEFPVEMPIAVDRRVAWVSASSGLIAVEGFSASRLMRALGEQPVAHRNVIVRAWHGVAEASGRSAFRLDSLIWQLGALINQRSEDRVAARDACAGVMASYGLDDETAADVADNLTARGESTHCWVRGTMRAPPGQERVERRTEEI